MSYTADCCATEGFNERVNRYDDIIGKDREAAEARKRVKGMLECLRQTLVRLHVSPEVMKMLDNLERLITDLESKDILAIAGDNMDGVGLAIHLGLMCEVPPQKPFDQDEK